MGVLGFDRSHFNAEPNFAAFKAGGGGFVICKATEGVGYTDATFAACRAGTEGAGLVFGSYHFARWGDPVAEARYYLSVATPRPGELVALDAEAAIPAGVDVVAWSLTFCQTVHAACGAWPLIYMNQTWMAAHNWAAVAANDGLWLAKYDGVPTGGPTGQWPVIAMKQFTDRGTVPGEAGTVDVDEFNGDLAALKRYAVPAAPVPPAPTPVPAPPEVDLDANQAQQLAAIYATVSFRRDYTAAPSAVTDDVGGHVYQARQQLDKLLAQLAQLAPMVQAQGQAIVALGQLVAQQNGLTLADVTKAIQDAIAAGVAVDVNVHPAA